LELDLYPRSSSCENLFRQTEDPDILERAFCIEERRKARVFLESMAEAGPLRASKIDAELRETHASCKARIACLQNDIQQECGRSDAIRQGSIEAWKAQLLNEQLRMETIMNRIRVSDPAFAHFSRPVPVDAPTLQGLLDPQTLYVGFALEEKTGMVLALDKDRCMLHGLMDVPALVRTVSDLVDRIEGRDEDVEAFAGDARALYLELIAPVEELLTGKTRIIISPDGILNYLPMEVLLTEEPSGGDHPSFAHLPYLVRKYSTVYVPSGTSYQFLLSRNRESQKRATDIEMKDLLALGDVPYLDDSQKEDSAQGWINLMVSRSGLKPLKHSRREIERISSYFSKDRVSLFLGATAREAVLKGKVLLQHRIIHLAAHALVDGDTPLLSSIILNAGAGEDGYFRAFEISETRINADLVVLSACRTLRGKLVIGEGVFGLVRAFIYAGANAVLATAWEVRDRFSAAFMDRFYRAHVRESMSRDRALQKAKLSAVQGKMDLPGSDPETYAHPYYWAPYVLFGIP